MKIDDYVTIISKLKASWLIRWPNIFTTRQTGLLPGRDERGVTVGNKYSGTRLDR